MLFNRYKISGYIVPSNDEYMSEYTPPSAKRLEYITGFTGSNGLVVICQDSAIFYTDGRYLEQSKHELDTEIFQIFDLQDLENFPWNNYIGDNGTLGYDSKLFINPQLKIFSHLAAPLLQISDNLVDLIWADRPAKPSSQVYIHEVKFAGQSHSDKITMCRETLTKYSADTMIITSTDSICWLLNLRANDIPHAPLMLSLVLLTHDRLYLFINPNRIDQEILDNRTEITILPEEDFENILTNNTNKVLVDKNFASNFIMDIINSKEIEIINDPCQLLKACKNDVEIQHAINFHIKDAIALCEFFAYLFAIDNLADLTEYDLAIKLTKFRSQQDGYIMDSFPTICGFKENSAIIHYHATKDKAQRILGNGILLIDSGAQYMGCTTDVTRTFVIGGTPTNEQKTRYTQVLKGHIALSSIRFPYVTTGSNLDVLARQFLWQDQLDYAHGTGHGVGSFLSVHEGPQRINLRNIVILEPGMILSNEPGYYLAGKFGMRIENLMYVKKIINHNFLKFETLTLVPYTKELINQTMLNIDEIHYIKQYYQKIKIHIYSLVSTRAQKWLDKQLAF